MKLYISPDAQSNYVDAAQVNGFPMPSYYEPEEVISCFLNSIGNGSIEPTDGFPAPFGETDVPFVSDYMQMQMNPDLCQLRLSDRARDYYMMQTWINGFAIDQKHWRRRSVGAYIARLCQGAFSDTRPDEIKASDEAFRGIGKALVWSDGSVRTNMVVIELLPATLDSLVQTAEYFNITTGKTRTRLAVAANVLEAIGCGYLTPYAQPAKTRTA